MTVDRRWTLLIGAGMVLLAGCSIASQGSADSEAAQYADTNLVAQIKERLPAASSASERTTSLATLLSGGPENLIPYPRCAWEAGATHDTGLPVVVYYRRPDDIFEKARWGRACRDILLTANDVKTKVVDCPDWAAETPGPEAVVWGP